MSRGTSYKGAPLPPEKFDVKKAWSILSQLVSLLWKDYKVHLLLAIFFLFFNIMAQVAGSLFFKTLIDKYVVPMMGESHPDFTPVIRLVMIMASIYLLGIVGNYLAQRMMIVVTQSFMKSMRQRLFNHMQALSVHYFDSNKTGELMSSYTNDIEMMRQFISQSLGSSISVVLTLSMVTTTMFIISPPLALIQLTSTLFIVPLVITLAKRSTKFYRQQQADVGALNGYVEEMIEGQKVIKVFSHEEPNIERFKEFNDALHRSVTKANRNGNLIWPSLGNFGYMQYILIATAGGAMAVHGIGGLTLGSIASFLSLSRTFTFPLAEVFQQFNVVMMAVAGAERVFGILAQDPEGDEGHIHLVKVNLDEHGAILGESSEHTHHWAWKEVLDDGSTRYTLLEGHIRFEDVSFSYVEGKRILKNISLEAKAGQKVALVGSTGAGKTTITNLLNRFYDIDSGRILYDGIDIRDICKSDLRQSLGVVLQETNLFSASIADNLRYGRPDASQEEIEKAATMAGADSFIKEQEKGYETIIDGDGAALSQGQKQLLSIARVEVADPPVMILDEATSSIDTRTELVVQAGMDALMHNRTVFVIAHRLSTIRNADLILVIEQGEIAERGNHEELMAQEGIYYRLVSQKSQYEETSATLS